MGSPTDKALDFSTQEGYELLAKQVQYYLLFMLPWIIEASGETKSDPFALAKANTYDALGIADAKFRIKLLTALDKSANIHASTAFSRTQNIPILRKIPPNILSGLVPNIKVYKVLYPGGFKAGNEVDYEVPFDDYTSRIGTTDIHKDILSDRKGGLDIASLVSFDYQFVGTNPAEAETSITAKMKLKFLSIEGLLDDRKIYPYNNHTTPASGKNFKYSDLVNQALKESPDYYRLKVKVGYNDVTVDYIQELLNQTHSNIYENPQIENLANLYAEAINDSQIFLYIYPVAHDLSFNENGTIDLNIEFRGAIERTLTGEDSNVLLSSASAKSKYDAITVVKDEIKRKRSELDAVKSTLEEAEFNRRKEALDNELKTQEQQIANNSADIYKEFLKKIIESPYIYAIDLSPDVAKKMQLIANGFSSDQIATGKELDAAISGLSVAGTSPAQLNFSGWSAGVSDIVKNLNAKVDKSAKDRTSSGSSATDGVFPGAISGNSIPTRLPFIFVKDLLKDIIDSALPEFTDRLIADDVYFVLGNMFIPTNHEFGQIIQSSSDRDFPRLSKRAKYIKSLENGVSFFQTNIGYLPISLDLFNKWFFQYVVNTGKIDWKLKNFLYDLVDLIRISTISIFGDKVSSIPGSRTLITATTVSKDLTKTFTKNPIITLKDKRAFSNFNDDPMNISNIIYIYTTNLILNDEINPLQIPQMEKDHGVFAFTVGSNVGLLKKISYKKMEIPGLREARATQQGELVTGTFRMKYDADIEMFGPCLFRPGDIVIINPVFLSRDTDANTLLKLANDLGLGGVYEVIRTNTDVSRDGVSTKLETVFQTYGSMLREYRINRERELAARYLEEERQNLMGPNSSRVLSQDEELQAQIRAEQRVVDERTARASGAS